MATEEPGPTQGDQAPNDDVVVLPTYRTTPESHEKLNPSKARRIAQEILEGELKGKIDDKECEEWTDFGDSFEALSKSVADKIKERCKAECGARYKLIVQTTIGQMKDQGVKFTSRCLWDTNTDNYAVATFQNQHVWATAIVFAMYTD
ncbi:hypothetical protein ACHAXT_001341 [Thalassiosira profunda]